MSPTGRRSAVRPSKNGGLRDVGRAVVPDVAVARRDRQRAPAVVALEDGRVGSPEELGIDASPMTVRISSGSGQMSARKTGCAVGPDAERLAWSGRCRPGRPGRRRRPAAARRGSWPAPADGCGPRSCGCPTGRRRRPGRSPRWPAATASSSGPRVADARRAAVADQREAERLERVHQPGRLEILGHGPRAGRQRGLDRRRRRAGRGRRRSGPAGRPRPSRSGWRCWCSEVIAAIATEPVRIVARCTADVDRDGPVEGRPSSGSVDRRRGLAGTLRLAAVGRRERRAGRSPGTTRRTPPRPPLPSIGSSPAQRVAGRPGPVGKFDRKLVAQVRRASTRSCGRRGPATDGSTLARSSSSSLVEDRARRPARATGPAPSRTRSTRCDALGRPTGQPEVGERLVVDREEGRGRPELGAHVADRRPVGQRQGRPARRRRTRRTRRRHRGRAASRSRPGRGRSRSMPRGSSPWSRTPTTCGIGW